MNALFVMPHYTINFVETAKFLDEAISSVLNQSDDGWHLLIVDDHSPDETARDYLRKIQLKHKEKIFVIFNTENVGPGGSRNVGVEFAKQGSYPFILYIDSDDICHGLRLEVTRKIFEENPRVSLVYTGFDVIDEFSSPVPYDNLDPSIKEILDCHEVNPPQGRNAWIDIGTKTGYANLTSTTAVRTDLAADQLFPIKRVSEDMHTWLRYSAAGQDFLFTSLVKAKYRIPQFVQGSSSRAREGGLSKFYREKSMVDEDGFIKAIEIAVANGKISRSMRAKLLHDFYIKLADTCLRVNETTLYKEIILKTAELTEA